MHQTAEKTKGPGNCLKSDFLPVGVIMMGTAGRKGEGFSFFFWGGKTCMKCCCLSGMLLPKAKFGRILDLIALWKNCKGAQITTGSSLAY